MQALAARPSAAAVRPAKAARRSSVVVRADGFIGSTTNLIMVASTGATLAAARFGLAPTVKKQATAGLKLVEGKNAAGVISNDPAGFTVVDVLAMGSAGHVLGVGIVLGLKGIGAL
ncbi:hypothetical protein GPECTOR_11g82 [Gonium pectorale]|uniref:PSI-K n=1 Tax=Gonium pectorale TaxID=33097 RepID=A0A150GQ50_GONPE|nr:hypothetical protein GPECTOR_11g82 [Gonium pectorale]|eukprot:KXZ51959.1 hypothetical protein GPECTOR_11g82 [Gonium pectorale]